jgi:hypothetical protein
MESHEVEKLHADCVTELKAYIKEANRTCSLVESMTAFPVPMDIWTGAVEQRVQENRAQSRYREARERLLDAMRPELRFDRRLRTAHSAPWSLPGDEAVATLTGKPDNSRALRSERLPRGKVRDHS